MSIAEGRREQIKFNTQDRSPGWRLLFEVELDPRSEFAFRPIELQGPTAWAGATRTGSVSPRRVSPLVGPIRCDTGSAVLQRYRCPIQIPVACNSNPSVILIGITKEERTSRNSSTIWRRSFSKTRLSCSLIVDPPELTTGPDCSCLTSCNWAAKLWSVSTLRPSSFHPFYIDKEKRMTEEIKTECLSLSNRQEVNVRGDTHTWLSDSGRGDTSELYSPIPASRLRTLPTWSSITSSSPLRRLTAPDMVGSERQAGPSPTHSDLSVENENKYTQSLDTRNSRRTI